MALTFLNRTPALLENLLEPFQKPVPGGPNGYYTTQKGAYLHSVEISGPYEAHGAGETPEPRSAFSSAVRRRRQATRAPARRRFSRRSPAARSGGRSPTPTSRRCSSFYKRGAAKASFELGIERAVEGLLVSPEFLYRDRARAERRGAGPAYRISDLELASRLSFFLWSSIPDDALLDAASSGKLRNPGVARAAGAPHAGRSARRGARHQLRRPVAVPAQPADRAARSEEGSGLRRGPAPGLPPRNGAVRRQHPARGPQRARSADRGLHVRQRAARPALRHSERLRHAISAASSMHDDNRRGLLGQGSVLAVTSYPNRTSPVVRGKWILENLLGTPPPPPPPDVPPLEEKPNAGGRRRCRCASGSRSIAPTPCARAATR